jgi:uncharacterized protein
MVWKMMAMAAVTLAVRAAPILSNSGSSTDLVVGDVDTPVMEPAPIDPAWIVEGAPVARFAKHSNGGDDAAVTGVWDCTAGTFRWHFSWDETVMILEGSVTVIAADGTERLLRAGDVAYFKAGTWYTWHVERYVRKLAFCRKPFPRPLTVAYRLRNLMRSGLA